MANLFFIEPSKTGYQHVTFLTGFLQAISASSAKERFELRLHASKSTLANLPLGAREGFLACEITVVDPTARQLVKKTFREFFEVLRVLRSASEDDRVIVSCILPTSLILVEIACLVLRRRRAFVVLHGELEGLCDSDWDPRRIGTWSKLWARVFGRRSSLNYVVLEDFIKQGLVARGFAAARVHVVHHVIPGVRENSKKTQNSTFCVIGFQTRQKGWDAVNRLVREFPEFDFVSVGGGRVLDLRTGSTEPFSAKDDFITAIARNHFALCMFERGYEMTLSASTLDAVAAGVKIIGLDCPFLRAVKSQFPDVELFANVDGVVNAIRANAIESEVTYVLPGTPYELRHLQREVDAIL
ncbi:MAG: hypothetical protein FJ184_02100 [Gammaproteobacteria bacterium]|nr:hypothetical protein [Gammaproteobacteria bacterium]